ncbi:hypothetical protein PAPYR_3527 [Paratrimastix pyriformis]|uniref:Kinesin motor domain-containing protein n=1 Tax=Paratrimastix pyriformis TaxID=342808 RepID=A0ABQ8UPU7_9EUKA|nr:hypothetical protein PAPYR_3527 [Paratrimastix pyriformis]
MPVHRDPTSRFSNLPRFICTYAALSCQTFLRVDYGDLSPRPHGGATESSGLGSFLSYANDRLQLDADLCRNYFSTNLFPQGSTTADIYQELVPYIHSFLSGSCACIIPLGDHGTGKTTVMLGDPETPNQPGLLSLVLQELLPHSARVCISAAMFYRNEWFDLLPPLPEGEKAKRPGPSLGASAGAAKSLAASSLRPVVLASAGRRITTENHSAAPSAAASGGTSGIRARSHLRRVPLARVASIAGFCTALRQRATAPQLHRPAPPSDLAQRSHLAVWVERCGGAAGDAGAEAGLLGMLDLACPDLGGLAAAGNRLSVGARTPLRTNSFFPRSLAALQGCLTLRKRVTGAIRRALGGQGPRGTGPPPPILAAVPQMPADEWSSSLPTPQRGGGEGSGPGLTAPTIPYRDHRFTQLLQDCIGPAAHVAILGCVSASVAHESNTRHTILFLRHLSFGRPPATPPSRQNASTQKGTAPPCPPEITALGAPPSCGPDSGFVRRWAARAVMSVDQLEALGLDRCASSPAPPPQSAGSTDPSQLEAHIHDLREFLRQAAVTKPPSDLPLSR